MEQPANVITPGDSSLQPINLRYSFGSARDGCVWTRMVGVLGVAVLGYYNHEAARNDFLGMIRASMLGRSFYVVLLAVGTDLWPLLAAAVPDIMGVCGRLLQ